MCCGGASRDQQLLPQEGDAGHYVTRRVCFVLVTHKNIDPLSHQHNKHSSTLLPHHSTHTHNRLRDKDMIARGEVPPDVEPGSELALFIIDGECPRCGWLVGVLECN